MPDPRLVRGRPDWRQQLNRAQYEAVLEAHDAISAIFDAEGIVGVAAALGIDSEVYMRVCDEMASYYFKTAPADDPEDLKLVFVGAVRQTFALGLRYGAQPPFRIGAKAAE